MANFKGVIKFIGEANTWALLQETTMIENNIVTSTGIGTGDGSERNFTATLTPVVEEGELSITVDGVAITATDADGVITGADITTSTGVESTIDYETGALDFTTTVAATPGLGTVIAVAYQYSTPSDFFDGHRLVKGDFSSNAVGDTIYYDYATFSDLNDGYNVTETFES